MADAGRARPTRTATGRPPPTRTSSAPSPSTSATTCSPTSGCSSATRGASTWSRSRPATCPRARARWPGVNWDLDREALAAELGFERPHPELARRRLQPRLRPRLPLRRRRSARCTSRGWAPRSCSGRARSSASASPPTRSPRARASCPRRRTPTPPSCCAARRRGSPPRWRACSARCTRLPLAYSKDMQEDKEPLFDATDNLELCLEAATRDARAGSASTASGSRRPPATSCWPRPTSPTCWSARAIPFREAHGVVGRPGPDRARRGQAALGADDARAGRRPRGRRASALRDALREGGTIESRSRRGAPPRRGSPSSSSRRARALGGPARG